MAHKTLINGTSYEITGGKTLVNGTGYSIASGKTLVGGTAYEIGFGEGVSPDGKILDSWATIKSGKNIGLYSIGNYKPLTLTNGDTINMEIAAFNTDIASDGTTAAITWISKTPYMTQRMGNGKSQITWLDSNVRKYLRGTFFNRLPKAVQDAIVPVKKTYYDCYTNATLTCDDTVWIPSYREVFGGDSYENSGVIYSDRFPNDSSRSYGVDWWLRTTKSFSFTTTIYYFQYVTDDGFGLSHGVTVYDYMMPCFCT